MEWVWRLQWKDIAAVTQMNSLQLAAMEGSHMQGAFSSPEGSPSRWQVPRADPEPIYPSLIWHLLVIIILVKDFLSNFLNSSFIKASANSYPWQWLAFHHWGRGRCRFWRGTECLVCAPLGGMPAEGTEQGQRPKGREGAWGRSRALGSGDLSWGRSALGDDQFPSGTGTQQWEKVSLAQWPAPMRLLRACRAWTTGTRRSEARFMWVSGLLLPAPDTRACWFTRNARMRYRCSAGWVSGWPREKAELQVFPWWAGTSLWFSVFDWRHKMGQL